MNYKQQEDILIKLIEDLITLYEALLTLANYSNLYKLGNKHGPTYYLTIAQQGYNYF